MSRLNAPLEDPIATQRKLLAAPLLALLFIGTAALGGVTVSHAATAQLHQPLDYAWQAFLAVGSGACLIAPRVRVGAQDVRMAVEALGAFLLATAFVAFSLIYIRATGQGAMAAISVTAAFAWMFAQHSLAIALRLALASRNR